MKSVTRSAYPIFMLVLASLTQTPALGQSGRLPSHYIDNEHGFSIDFPRDWWVGRGMSTNTIVKALWRDGRDTATILVSVNRDGVGIATVDPAEFARDLATSTPGSLNGYGRDSAVTGNPLWVDFTLDIALPRRALYYAIPHNGNVVLVTCTSHPRNFERHSREFLNTARSVSLSTAEAETPRATDSVVLRDSTLGLMLKLPSGWTPQPARRGSGQGEVLYCLGPATAGQPTRPLLMVDYATEDAGLSAAEIVKFPDSLLGSGSSGLADVRLVAKSVTTLAGHEAVRADLSITYRGPANPPWRSRGIQFWIPLRDGLLSIKATVDERNEQDYESITAALMAMTLSPVRPDSDAPHRKRNVPWPLLVAVGAVCLGAAVGLTRRARPGPAGGPEV